MFKTTIKFILVLAFLFNLFLTFSLINRSAVQQRQISNLHVQTQLLQEQIDNLSEIVNPVQRFPF
jgi:regulatory protein YycI of two-component signal transduction system YycFG